MGRIERREDDLYMLYTGGTTGMPKGVMYAVGGSTAALAGSGYPLLGMELPELGRSRWHRWSNDSPTPAVSTHRSPAPQ